MGHRNAQHTITHSIQTIMANAININEIQNGTKIISNKMIMVVTGKTKTAFVGYIERDGKKISGDDVQIQFATFSNPHYSSGIMIVHPSIEMLTSITKQMNALEAVITREQNYIAKHGAANDIDSDSIWEQYKQTAEFHLTAWDYLKGKRDWIKTFCAV